MRCRTVAIRACIFVAILCVLALMYGIFKSGMSRKTGSVFPYNIEIEIVSISFEDDKSATVAANIISSQYKGYTAGSVVEFVFEGSSFYQLVEQEIAVGDTVTICILSDSVSSCGVYAIVSA